MITDKDLIKHHTTDSWSPLLIPISTLKELYISTWSRHCLHQHTGRTFVRGITRKGFNLNMRIPSRNKGNSRLRPEKLYKSWAPQDGSVNTGGSDVIEVRSVCVFTQCRPQAQYCCFACGFPGPYLWLQKIKIAGLLFKSAWFGYYL